LSVTEAEWVTCIDPNPMLGFLRGNASQRKMRLFACACSRSIWQLFTDPRSRRAVQIAEKAADGMATETELASVKEALEQLDFSGQPAQATKRIAYKVAFQKDQINADISRDVDEANTADDAAGVAAYSVVKRSSDPAGWEAARNGEKERQTAFLRDIFGNPFRPVAIDPAWLAWRDGTVPKIARTIYDERRFAELSILADALEEAGCADAEILIHCRGDDPHVRGCWVVDFLLGKE
jgi:hypothetical protein